MPFGHVCYPRAEEVGDAVSANALVYSSAIEMDKSVDVRARSFDGFKWSPSKPSRFS